MITADSKRTTSKKESRSGSRKQHNTKQAHCKPSQSSLIVANAEQAPNVKLVCESKKDSIASGTGRQGFEWQMTGAESFLNQKALQGNNTS
jgi:hypothetical protein